MTTVETERITSSAAHSSRDDRDHVASEIRACRLAQLVRMLRLATVAATLAVLAGPASALAAQVSRSQRLAIGRSARITRPCGYDGQTSQLSDFRAATFGSAHFTVHFASVMWTPPDDQGCQLIFVNQPGYNLKSVVTTKHPYVSWAPLTWGSSPFDEPSALSRTWNYWFSAEPPPSWAAVARALN